MRIQKRSMCSASKEDPSLDPTQLRAVQYHRSAHIIYANKASVRLYLCVSVYVTSAKNQSLEIWDKDIKNAHVPGPHYAT